MGCRKQAKYAQFQSHKLPQVHASSRHCISVSTAASHHGNATATVIYSPHRYLQRRLLAVSFTRLFSDRDGDAGVIQVSKGFVWVLPWRVSLESFLALAWRHHYTLWLHFTLCPSAVSLFSPKCFFLFILCGFTPPKQHKKCQQSVSIATFLVYCKF